MLTLFQPSYKRCQLLKINMQDTIRFLIIMFDMFIAKLYGFITENISSQMRNYHNSFIIRKCLEGEGAGCKQFMLIVSNNSK